ncbi:MAG: hypothetical protein ACRC2T_19865 [Thermoguttaceae bacterium]
MKNVMVVLFLLVSGLCQIVFGGTLTGQYCFTKPAGDTSGGEQCATKACYESSEGSSVYYRHDGVSYKKCGKFEAYNCEQSTGNPICAYKYRYASLADCTAKNNGSTSQTFQSSSNSCS